MLYIYGNRFDPKMLGSAMSHQKTKQTNKQTNKQKAKQQTNKKAKQQVLTIPRCNETFCCFSATL